MGRSRQRHRDLTSTVLAWLAVAAVVPGALGTAAAGQDRQDQPAPATPTWGALLGVGVVAASSSDPASRAGEPGAHVPAVDPLADLAVFEPDYGDVPEAQVRLAAAVLQLTAPPAQLTTEEATALVAEAERRMEAVLALTGASFSPTDLLGVAGQLGLEAPATSAVGSSELALAMQLDLAALHAAATQRLRPALLSFGVEPAGDRPEELAAAVREALTRAGSPATAATTLSLDDIRWLSALATVADAPARWTHADLDTPLAPPAWADADARAATMGPAQAGGGPQATLVRLLGQGRALFRVGGGTAGAPVAGWLVVFDPRRTAVRTTPAAGPLGTLATVAAAAERTGASVAVNGGFWLGGGDPDGLLVDTGVLLSDPTAWVRFARNQRSAFGVLADGTPLVGIPGWDARLELDGVTSLPIRGVNRSAVGDDVVVFTAGERIASHADAIVVIVEAVPLMAGGDHALRVLSAGGMADLGSTVVADGTFAIVSTGKYASRAALIAGEHALGAADVVVLRTDVSDGWSGVDTALNAGPLALVHGIATGEDQWRSEGFDTTHTDRRHPRTALGFDDAGVGYLLVIDGRQPGWSVGLSQLETARWLRSVGATQGLQLDGGGSSTLVIDGEVVNRPCCDATPRPVATVLLLDDAA